MRHLTRTERRTIAAAIEVVKNRLVIEQYSYKVTGDVHEWTQLLHPEIRRVITIDAAHAEGTVHTGRHYTWHLSQARLTAATVIDELYLAGVGVPRATKSPAAWKAGIYHAA